MTHATGSGLRRRADLARRDPPTRRHVLTGIAAGTALCSVPTGWAIAQARPLKVGLMLPFSGTFARVGDTISSAIELLIAEQGGRLGGREIQFIQLDDESNPDLAAANAERLVKRDQVDVIIGSVHAGVQIGLHKVVSESGTLCIVPSAGNGPVTGALCARNVFRTSFTNWQPAYGMGLAVTAKGARKGVWITWDNAAGAESATGFKQAMEAGGGTALPSLTLPFPQTNFQPLLRQVRDLDVDVVGAFFAGGGAVQFVKAYRAANLTAPLVGSGFLAEGTLQALGAAAQGMETALHYGDGLDTPKNIAFRQAFKDKVGRDADVTAVQGYDAGQLLAVGLEAVGGNVDDTAGLYAAMRSARLDSPRGPISLSPSQSVTQNIYLRRVEGSENRVVGIAAEALADPGAGCTAT